MRLVENDPLEGEGEQLAVLGNSQVLGHPHVLHLLGGQLVLPHLGLDLGEDDPVSGDDDVILGHLPLCYLALLGTVVHQHAQPARFHLEY